MTVIERIAIGVAAICNGGGLAKTPEDWQAELEELAREHLPSGSGVDSGTEIDFDESKPDRITLTCSFHHMDDMGSYCGWTEHRIILRPSFIGGFDIAITGRNRRQIKEYLADLYTTALTADLP
jgi:hypothetical protein